MIPTATIVIAELNLIVLGPLVRTDFGTRYIPVVTWLIEVVLRALCLHFMTDLFIPITFRIYRQTYDCHAHTDTNFVF